MSGSTLARVGLFLLALTLLGSSGLAQSGVITTYVGPPMPLNGAQVLTQAVDAPYSVALDGAGGFYVASQSQNRVYRVAADGTLTLIAGSSFYGFSGDGGPATAARLANPQDVAVDLAG